jgi:tetratricopeptide (TPR) repeat protein
VSGLPRTEIRKRYPNIRDDHLRYLEKWGLIRPAVRVAPDAVYDFQDLRVIRQTSAELAEGRPFRAIVRALEASRHGQLAFDFRLDAQPAKILKLERVERPAHTTPEEASPSLTQATGLAEQYFTAASALDTAPESPQLDEAATLYRRALEEDPYLVAALINLGNLHYARNELAEAQALYEQAIGLAPDYFEAHYNLANVFHDLGRFAEAHDHYLAALTVNSRYADAHFYLAVTLEKMGRSAEARPHWKAYQELAPEGDWVALAREFSE